MSAKVTVVPLSGGVFQLKRNLAELKAGKYIRTEEIPGMVSRRRFRWKDRFTIEEIRFGTPTGPLGVGNALPFSRVRNKLLKPERLHYKIPAVGARARLLRVRDVNQFQGGNKCHQL